MSAGHPLDVNERPIHRTRAVSPADATALVVWILRQFPVPRSLAASLPLVLARLISDEILLGEVVEYIFGGPRQPVLAAFGLSGFLSNAHADQYLAAPYPYLELDLLERASHRNAKTPFLEPQQIANANATDGLTVFPLMWLQRTTDPGDLETRTLLLACQQGFMRVHRGYRIARILKETTADRADAFLAGGFREYCRFPAGTPHRYVGRKLKQDHIVFEANRSVIERSLPGAAISHLFEYQPPRCGFTVAEKQVLQRGSDHQTDAEIAAGIGITPTAVALRWRSIYERVLVRAPSVLRDAPNSFGTTRGKEKRRRVLGFVSDHPEEMRPYP